MVLARMRARLRSKLAMPAIGVLLAGVCTAQTGDVVHFNGPVTRADTNRYTVTGSVSNSVTGEPVRRALVHLGQFSAFSGADGRFQIDGVTAGQYNATAQRPGFFDPAQTGSGPYPSMISVGPNTPAISLKLLPESAIEGRVLSNTGEPIENAQVQVISEQIANGRKTLQSTGNDATDDAGDFRIENLMPGKYYVQVLQQPVFGFANLLGSGAPNREVYPEEFYPNAPDIGSAQALDVKPGEAARVDFTLSPKTSFRISGTITPSAPNGIFATLQDTSGEETQVGIQFHPQTGRWMLPSVPPGAWTLVFRAQNQPGDAYYAEQRIDVRGSDIENVQIVLQPLPPIPVQVVNAPESGAQSVQVQLMPRSGRLNSQQFMAAPQSGNASGALFLRDVTPGVYNVAVQSNGQSCIESVMSGAVDLAHDPLVISAGSPPPPIQVSLRQDCATLDVTVQSQDHAGMTGLILVTDSQAFQPKIAFVPPGAHMSFGPLTPGVYRLYATANPNNLEYSNPEAMRNIDGQEITLAPNQQATASVTIPGSAANQ